MNTKAREEEGFFLGGALGIKIGPTHLTSVLSQVSAGSQRRLIKLATKPAPKPLSILTTVTLEEQLFSIPSNAATPPKDAP
jgi:hypothetical protein